LSFTIRPNTSGAGWAQIEHDDGDVPSDVRDVRTNARPKLIDHQTAAKIDSWIKQMGWAAHEAPVFLEPLE
jgi:hypothetical protein